ncbi:PaaI family thioesterase [Pseudomonas mangiferae]|uniref:PaaI family thioesterase n=1 Tax=Pseudomonas mangiferae TaxID=2593654 RepID=A0A553H090_9PSED|nr:PaaI family thioesterase [Pseudomonas mangiferae]TRX75159.1 PaaI family thioesterase [Pseudomonas mangiferae]
MEIPHELAMSAFGRLIGCRPLAMEKGRAEVALSLTPDLHNRLGKLHGGALFSLLDIAMSLACSSVHGFESRSVTQECKINYMRGVDDGEVVCVATVVHAGSRSLVVEADIRQGEALVAKGLGTFALL